MNPSLKLLENDYTMNMKYLILLCLFVQIPAFSQEIDPEREKVLIEIEKQKKLQEARQEETLKLIEAEKVRPVEHKIEHRPKPQIDPVDEEKMRNAERLKQIEAELKEINKKKAEFEEKLRKKKEQEAEERKLTEAAAAKKASERPKQEAVPAPVSDKKVDQAVALKGPADTAATVNASEAAAATEAAVKAASAAEVMAEVKAAVEAGAAKKALAIGEAKANIEASSASANTGGADQGLAVAGRGGDWSSGRSTSNDCISHDFNQHPTESIPLDYQDCNGEQSTLAANKIACWGWWDYGSCAGHDTRTCGGLGSGQGHTGCVIPASKCISGKAKAIAAKSMKGCSKCLITIWEYACL